MFYLASYAGEPTLQFEVEMNKHTLGVLWLALAPQRSSLEWKCECSNVPCIAKAYVSMPSQRYAGLKGSNFSLRALRWSH